MTTTKTTKQANEERREDGWHFRVGDVWSAQAFPSRDRAREARRRYADEDETAGAAEVPLTSHVAAVTAVPEPSTVEASSPEPEAVPTAGEPAPETSTEPAHAAAEKEISGDPKKVVDKPETPVLQSPQPPIPGNNATAEPAKERTRTMTLTLKSLNKKGTQAYYTGANQIIRFMLGVFPNKTAPATIDVPGDVFVAPTAKVAKPKMTAEERKAARAAKPKPTLAERIAREEKRLADLKAKAATEGAGATEGASAGM